MGIYFRDILLTRISRGANNCGQHPLEKNSYFIMRFSPHFQLFYFNDRLEFCKFFEGKIKRINNADLFSQLPLLIFIKGANISGGHCMIYQGSPTLLSFRVQLQPQSNTPKPANQSVHCYLIITGRCIWAGLELKWTDMQLFLGKWNARLE